MLSFESIFKKGCNTILLVTHASKLFLILYNTTQILTPFGEDVYWFQQTSNCVKLDNPDSSSINRRHVPEHFSFRRINMECFRVFITLIFILKGF